MPNYFMKAGVSLTADIKTKVGKIAYDMAVAAKKSRSNLCNQNFNRRLNQKRHIYPNI